MRPDARAQSAIEILDLWLADQTGLDRVLAQWARTNRYAGSKDRAAIADLVYGAVRRLRSANWAACGEQPASGRTLIHGATLLDQASIDQLFSGERYAPDSLSEAEISARCDLGTAPHAIRYDYPDWLSQHLDGVSDADLDALRERAPLDLRVNTLKSDREEALKSLTAEGISAQAIPGSETALRVLDGNRKVARSTAYAHGMVEIQDFGSQQLADLAEPQPGEQIIDLCAGGGGKSLAMAAQAGGNARIFAYDVSPARLSDLPQRAERAGAKINILTAKDVAQRSETADVVFVDAPCSGSGAWRRNPDAKWQLTEERLASLNTIQAELLEQAADLCAPSGRIVYGTCSILNVENIDRINEFLTKATQWSEINRLVLRPTNGCDGFFGAVLTR
ncbi:MAG: RsmB/NOP family class I SAM-dependent RNA methyltransferase [Pseudomonadota bacterium]